MGTVRKVLVILCMLILCGYSYSWSACTGSSPTWTSSADRTSVDQCVSDASGGDTINVQAGTQSWASAITVPATKELWIKGAGIGATVISGNSFDLTDYGTSKVRISGFTFSNALPDLYGVNGDRVIIIDNNRLAQSSGTDWEIRGYDESTVTNFKHPTVIIANNQLTHVRVYNCATNWGIQEGRNYQGVLWTQNTTWGGYTNVNYIEGNTFESCNENASYSCVDSNWGGRFVFRFNTINAYHGYIEEHTIIGDSHRGNQRWEIYNNDLTGGNNDRFGLIQGSGSGLIFNNLLSNTMSSVDVGNRRSSVGAVPGLNCDGTNATGWDGNTSGQHGYPCRDQIGRVKDPSLWEPGQAYGTQTLQPAYIFNNKTPSNAEMTMGIPNYGGSPDYQSEHIQANRDYYIYNASFNGTSGVGVGTLAACPATCTTGVGYWATDQGSWNLSGSGGQGVLYKCTATNTWTSYYTPYIYPHPLRGEGGDTTAPTVTITTGDSSIVADSLYVYGTSEDIIGVTLCKYRIGAAPTDVSGVTTTNTTAWNATTTGYSQGANTLYVGCRDAAGNWGTDTITVNRDSVAPTVTITSPTSSATYDTSSLTITLGGTSSSDTASVAYSNAAGGSGSCTGTTSWTCSNITLTSGSGNVITVTGTDAFSNQGTDIITVTYTPPDTTPPSVTITTTDPTNTSLSTQSVAWNASDAVGVTSCKWRIGSAPDAFNGTTDGSSPATISGYAVGANTVYIGCTDAAGNWGSDSLTINYAPPGGSGCYIQGGKAQ